MSRTTRRERPVNNRRRWFGLATEPQGDAKPATSRCRDGSTAREFNADIKIRTNEKRRAYWRKKAHEILLHDDADVANMEKLYLGEEWNWD